MVPLCGDHLSSNFIPEVLTKLAKTDLDRLRRYEYLISLHESGKLDDESFESFKKDSLLWKSLHNYEKLHNHEKVLPPVIPKCLPEEELAILKAERHNVQCSCNGRIESCPTCYCSGYYARDGLGNKV